LIQDFYLVRGIKRALGLHQPGRMLDVRPDDTFLVSYPKSGSTWVRFLVANLIAPEKNPDFTNINALFPDYQAFSKRALGRLPRPRTMKSHQYFDPRYRKVVYVVRDPRDVVLAEYHFGIKQRLHDENYPLAAYIPRFLAGNTGHAYGSWYEHLASWYFTRRNYPRFLLVQYESLHAQTAIELARIADFLGIACDPSKLAFAIEQSDAKRLRALEKKQAHVFSSTKETRLDLPYIRVAKAGGWRVNLSGEHVAQIESAWGDLMEEMGYELTVATRNEVATQ
jgi:hypothetical protein